MNNEHIMIKNARVSFPHLFTKPVINGEEGKCGAVLMLDPDNHQKTIKTINNRINGLIKEKLKGKKLPSDKLCLRDGEDKGRSEYEGLLILSASNKNRPVVVGSKSKDGKVVVITNEEDSQIYAGCYVNAKIRLWVQNNIYGKRVNAELVSIQFAADGESLDGSYVSVEDAIEGFDSIDDEDMDFLVA